MSDNDDKLGDAEGLSDLQVYIAQDAKEMDHLGPVPEAVLTNAQQFQGTDVFNIEAFPMAGSFQTLALTSIIHGRNVAFGWWSDLNTGERIERNYGELIALAQSEISEGWHGYAIALMDDHLPQYPMLQVELADAAIRTYDMAGGHDLNIPRAMLTVAQEKHKVLGVGIRTVAERLCHIHWCYSMSFECYRKSNKEGATLWLAAALVNIYKLAADCQYDLGQAIYDKMVYNAARADHKREARLAPDGKKL